MWCSKIKAEPSQQVDGNWQSQMQRLRMSAAAIINSASRA
jgi:hypothetical protein